MRGRIEACKLYAQPSCVQGDLHESPSSYQHLRLHYCQFRPQSDNERRAQFNCSSAAESRPD
ncbi:hypothetical protein JG688_00010465 [Phytophthora aleatoria]|uniref:Uncharacterized protein n=1 Tax=Phytophthora aleatoria TaxID=2496075 RepID=A0A8J5IQ88_9STRA|nr:hypothetical protein JG688_00010465 [Phytophthora aleatoria]